jgi:hypothetical protein
MNFLLTPALLDSSLYLYSLLGRGEMPHFQLKSLKKESYAKLFQSIKDSPAALVQKDRKKNSER